RLPHQLPPNSHTNSHSHVAPLPPTYIANDIYVNEIRQAVTLGLISGFEDNTFRPRATLTREQLVSIVFDGISKNISSNLNLQTRLVANPYPDVAASRWSATKIQWAKDNRIVSGYEDGTFRPGQPVTRAELIAVQRRAAEYALTLRGQPADLSPRLTPIVFRDTVNHWASGLINQMSGYCRVASPINEVGVLFEPNTATQRNYAAAATLRMINCVKASGT
ncbi:MAG: S-layer homology domain-containing protein, partial [Coleofasciculaceae cyanobacterium SM2_1_6]|nr:S-layer homology domain-containing protein [Coleofasciculaceae cyanobacterium SM2_1_6]